MHSEQFCIVVEIAIENPRCENTFIFILMLKYFSIKNLNIACTYFLLLAQQLKGAFVGDFSSLLIRTHQQVHQPLTETLEFIPAAPIYIA